MITTACLVVWGVPYHKTEEIDASYAKRTAQNALLALQNIPVKEFESLSYTPDLPIFNSSRRNLREKTLAKLIIEEVLINPPSGVFYDIESKNDPYQFSKELREILEEALDRLIGGRFGYRMIVRLKPIPVSKAETLRLKRVIQDFDGDLQKLCSESVRLNFAIPQVWLDYTQQSDDKLSDFQLSGYPKSRIGTLILNLELWSK